MKSKIIFILLGIALIGSSAFIFLIKEEENSDEQREITGPYPEGPYRPGENPFKDIDLSKKEEEKEEDDSVYRDDGEEVLQEEDRVDEIPEEEEEKEEDEEEEEKEEDENNTE